jgi:small-conductance mechanosensitive channel
MEAAHGAAAAQTRIAHIRIAHRARRRRTDYARAASSVVATFAVTAAMTKERTLDWSIPPLFQRQLGALELWQWLGLLLWLLVGTAIGLVLASLVRRLLELIVQRTTMPWDDKVAQAVHAPVRLWCSLVVTFLLYRTLELPDELLEDIAKLVRSGSIAATVWGMIRALYAIGERVADASLGHETVDPQRLARARSLRTQVIVASRVLSVLLFVIGAAFVALQFSIVRSFGVSLLASAGVAGVALGFAAQKSLGALLAGIQISMSQPIRIGDSVNVENEFGVIEDIGLTYVTMKLWDERRLIVPTPRFLEQPFRNWSRTNVGLLGTVFLRVDYDIPLTALRDEFERLIVSEPMWDGRIKTLQVTDAGDRAIEVRLLISASNPGALWDLRASIREKLVLWLQTFEQGKHVPRTRISVADAREPQPSSMMR